MFKISIEENNMGCVKDSTTPILSDFSKHVDLKYKFLIDHITKEEVDIHYVPYNQMSADFVTNILKEIEFKEMAGLINLI